MSCRSREVDCIVSVRRFTGPEAIKRKRLTLICHHDVVEIEAPPMHTRRRVPHGRLLVHPEERCSTLYVLGAKLAAEDAALVLAANGMAVA